MDNETIELMLSLIEWDQVERIRPLLQASALAHCNNNVGTGKDEANHTPNTMGRVVLSGLKYYSLEELRGMGFSIPPGVIVTDVEVSVKGSTTYGLLVPERPRAASVEED